METDIRLRKLVREIITEIYEQLEKRLINPEKTGDDTPGTIEEQSTEPQTARKDPSMADKKE